MLEAYNRRQNIPLGLQETACEPGLPLICPTSDQELYLLISSPGDDDEGFGSYFQDLTVALNSGTAMEIPGPC